LILIAGSFLLWGIAPRCFCRKSQGTVDQAAEKLGGQVL
jgi:hypothetical protein